MVVGGVSWLILIAGRVGITIVLPVEQSGGTTIVIEKLEDSGGTEGYLVNEHVIVTMDVPSTSDVYRV